MLLKRLVLYVAAGVLVANGLDARPVAAESLDPCSGTAVSSEPLSCGAPSDLFPGARLGLRTGPQANGARLTADQADAAAEAATAKVLCDGDGESGKRVEVLYVREPSMPDRFTQLMPMFQAWLANADDAYNDAAAEGGQSRHIRYVTEAVSGGCQVAVRQVTVPADSLATFDSGITAVKALGYDKADRKYLMLTEATVECGRGGRYNDDRPDAANYNNRTTYARVDAIPNCFGANAIAHELGHTFGAVQPSAPHSYSGHCTDQFDLMCYGGTPSWDCVEWNDYRVPDCNRDDYFNVSPEADSYLATHWNSADSDFLIKGAAADVVGHPTVGFTYAITSVSTGGAIEPIDGSTTGLVRLSQRARTNGASQKWIMGYKTGLQFINANSRMCVDSAYSGTTSGTQVLQYGCNGQDGMRWAYLPQADGSYAIINWLSGLALTVTGAYPAPLEQRPYTGATNQRWKFNRITDPGPQDGAKYYLTGIGNRENAEVLNGALTSGAVVTHKAHSGATRQQWTLRKAASDTFPARLVNVNSGLCLDLKTPSDAAGTQIVQSTCTASNAQMWTVRRAADGTYVLVNVHSQRVLNMTTGTSSALDQQVLAGNNANHFWALKPI
ncbi:RICIN domain-containing protein [Nonomuraea sp. NPDC048901]|uniref:RICIN domain-containing protein n=1 Tax=Nonomuraea sp. NPDC048901 TaxID=3155627 RepID=UPI0033DBF055